MSAALPPAVEEPTTKTKAKVSAASDYLAAQNFEVFGKH
jgi:hypothetical protein